MIVRNESQTLFLNSAIGFYYWINTHMHACLHHYHSPHTNIHTFDLYNNNSLNIKQARNWTSAVKFCSFKIPKKRTEKQETNWFAVLAIFQKYPFDFVPLLWWKNHFEWHLHFACVYTYIRTVIMFKGILVAAMGWDSYGKILFIQLLTIF